MYFLNIILREKKVLSTQTIQKNNKSGHVVLTTPFTFYLLKNVGSYAKHSAFFRVDFFSLATRGRRGRDSATREVIQM
jgi:hypothetical protein